MKKNIFSIIIIFVFLTGFDLSCNGEELTISAAASLTNALKELGTLFETEHPGERLFFNLAASGTLARQIESGAPVDVFISAAPEQMDQLESKGLILKETRKNILTNDVVLIIPRNSALKVKEFEDLLNPSIQKIALGDPGFVPIGLYSEEILRNLRLWDRLKSEFVFGEDVRQVLEYVVRGEADAGIVFSSDAMIMREKVKVAATAPEKSHRPVIYPVAVIKGTRRPELAKKWVEFAESRAGKTIFAKYGLKPVE